MAYEIIKRPVFVADSGFYINAYPNNPGYLVRLLKEVVLVLILKS